MPDYPCPNCGGTLHVNEGTRTAWVLMCHTCAPSGEDYEARMHWARDLARESGAPDTRSFLKNPPLYLDDGQMVRRGPRGPRDPLPLPDLSRVQGMQERLFSGTAGAARARRWLVRERGVRLREARRWGLGWNGDELVFPLMDGDRLVTIKFRKPVKGANMRNWPGIGKGFPLFADGGEPSLLLVAGELDALAARSAGIPACSITHGASTPLLPEWVVALNGRRVTVCYDRGEERLGALAARALGSTTDQLILPGPGKDVSDFLAEHGRGGLLRLLRANTDWGRV